MNVFIIPSWCPEPDNSLAGSFFLEQAHMLARLRPEWKVAICCCSMISSRPSRKPWKWIDYVKRYLTVSRFVTEKHSDGLIEYRIWEPHGNPFFRNLASDVKHLEQHAGRAMKDFLAHNDKIDVIHALASTPGGTAAVRLGKTNEIPVVISEHMGNIPWPLHQQADGSPVAEIMEAYSGAVACSAVSTSLSRQIQRLGLRNEITVIPNFLDAEQFRHDPSPKKDSSCSFLSVCWPGKAKGTDILLQAFAALEAPSTLTIVGDSRERNFWEKLSVKLGIAERVSWLGNVPRGKIAAIYQNCDVFVLPSRAESFGVVYLEALASGKPLIATRCGGPEDIVTSANGLLVPVNDVNALAEAMRNMSGNYRNYDSGLIRTDFENRFSAETIVERLECWYSESIAAYSNEKKSGAKL